MSEPSEREIIARLEQGVDWAEQGIVERDGELLLSLDESLDRLTNVYESHSREVGLVNARGAELATSLGRVAQLLQVEFANFPELTPGVQMQTRGQGLCMAMDDRLPKHEPAGLGAGIHLRGEFAGVYILPALTDYARITQQYDSIDLYEPRLCVILRGSNITSLSSFDNVQLEDGVVAIPLLGDDGLRLDRVV